MKFAEIYYTKISDYVYVNCYALDIDYFVIVSSL